MFGKSKRVLLIICKDYRKQLDTATLHKFVKTCITNWIYKLEAKEINGIDVIEFE